MNKRVLTIIGTRPEAIKMAPIYSALLAETKRSTHYICITGQHREMLEQVLRMFNIRVDFDLKIMAPDQTLAGITSLIINGVDRVLREVMPDLILVQGDTTTVLAASLAAFYLRIPVSHVEAGLRTYDRMRPFPEEVNRRVCDMVADVYYAPTQGARANLLNEGVSGSRILVTGNTGIDSVRVASENPYDWKEGPLRDIPRDRRLILVTAHRREHFGAGFRNICLAIRRLAQEFGSSIHIVYPVHLNPNVRAPVGEILQGVENITLLEPLEYLPMVHLMRASYFVLTDSGGIQEEAPFLAKPVLVMRDSTERPEAVNLGSALLVGTSEARILFEARRLLTSPDQYRAMASVGSPYGDGRAAQRIVAHLLDGTMDEWSTV